MLDSSVTVSRLPRYTAQCDERGWHVHDGLKACRVTAYCANRASALALAGSNNTVWEYAVTRYAFGETHL